MSPGDIVIYLGNPNHIRPELTLNRKYKIIRLIDVFAINITNDNDLNWNYPINLFKLLDEHRDEKLKDLGI